MKKMFIKNRKNQKIAVIIEKNPRQNGLAFVMHGLSGFKEQTHIKTFADAFYKKGFTVIRFDTTNTFGESGGKYENATTTNYYEDLEDVINWAKTQKWYQEPFWLAGHSLGGICTALYGENYPEQVKALAPIATVVSGKLSMEAKSEEMIQWRKKGYIDEEHSSRPGVIKRLKWDHMIDRLKYDLLKKVDKLTMPVLLIVGENDTLEHYNSQKILYDKLSGKKELHLVEGAPHTFREPKHLAQIKKIFLKWIGEYND